MPDARYFAEKAERCRELMAQARTPEIREQLRLWAEEFELMAQVFAVHRIGSRHAVAEPIDLAADERVRIELDDNDSIA